MACPIPYGGHKKIKLRNLGHNSSYTGILLDSPITANMVVLVAARLCATR